MKRTPQELTGEFEKTINDSVKMHLISDAPLATMCSGGLDSSVTTAVAKDYKSDVVAYVANVVGPISEGAKAEMVGRHIGAPVRRIDVDREDLLRLWPTAIWHGDQPNCHANDMPYMMVTRACRADGIKVVLTGEGSDELFGGYSWQAKVHQMWKMRRMHSEIIKDNSFFKFLGKFHNRLKPLNMELLKQYPFLRQEEISYQQELLRNIAITDGGRRLLRQRELFEKLEQIEPIEDRAFLARAFEDWYGNLQAVLHRNDRISMAASIESRPPFLENQMINLGMHFPARLKYHKDSCKWVVKALGDKKLPRDIVHATKLHFPLAMDAFQDVSSYIEGGIVPQLFKWGREETKNVLGKMSKFSQVTYNVLCIEVWARMFFQGAKPEQIGEDLMQLRSKKIESRKKAGEVVKAASGPKIKREEAKLWAAHS